MLQLESLQQSWHSANNGQRPLSIPAIDHLTAVTHLSRALHAAAERTLCLLVMKHACKICYVISFSLCLGTCNAISSPIQPHVAIDTQFELVFCSLRLNAPIKVLDTCELLMELVMLKPHLIQVMIPIGAALGTRTVLHECASLFGGGDADITYLLQGCQKVYQLCLVHHRIEALLRDQKLQQKAAEGPVAVTSVLHMLEGYDTKAGIVQTALLADGSSQQLAQKANS